MNSTPTVSAPVDSLEVLAEQWRSASAAESAPALDVFRERLIVLAVEAEALGREANGQAMRRIASLSEVWECLQSDPGQAEAASELATFCLEALTRLARGEPANTDEESASALWVLDRSGERWSDYLALFDPAGNIGEFGEPADSCDQACFPEQDEPTAIDARALLRLITGSDDADVPRAVALPVSLAPAPANVELDDEMKEAFLAEATELFERIEGLVVGLSAHGDSREAAGELARCFHTLKGAAGSVGFAELAARVHALEERLGEASGRVSTALSDSLHDIVGYLDGVIRSLRRGPAPSGACVVPPGRADEIVSAPAAAETGAPRLEPAVDAPLRVSTARFDELTDLAGELIAQARFWLSQSESIRTFAATVKASRNRLLTSMERLHESGPARDCRLPRATVDFPADLSVQLCRLAEQADDLSVLAASAQATAGLMTDRGDTLVRLSRRLWDEFQSLRIVSIRGLFHRLARAIHEAERVEGKQVEVIMVGEETGVDRAVQDKAFEPLLHVVRNAVGHGIELPADRARAGKPAAGRVTLEARREGNALVIAVEDDGKGLDYQAIADKARRLGWLADDEPPSLEKLRAYIFQPGFSTRSEVNAISGRGVGMDVVAREVSRLRGTIDLTSEPGRGSRFTLRLPSQLALETALIVRVAGRGFAVPASQIECVQPFARSRNGPASHRDENGRASASSTAARPSVVIGDQNAPVIFAGETLGIGRAAAPTWSMLLVVKTGRRVIGLVVDTIERTEDLVIKPLGALLAGHPLVSGTSLSVNGELISVLNPSGLERWLSLREGSESASALARSVSEPSGRVRVDAATVLVVDDSISVRRGLARQLRGLGLDVHEVSDGMEALARLRGSNYAFVVTDLEMPRLDGFALLAEMKRSASLAAIPVVVASTLADAETRRRVIELGARALLSKPVDARELARTVEPFRPRVGTICCETKQPET